MKYIQKLFAIALLTVVANANAQQVNTLYFLENAPMRHLVNPAFQPVSNGYVNFTPLGYTSLWVGNNSLTVSDLLYVEPTTGKTITALHPNGDRQALSDAFRKNTLIGSDFTTNLLGFGFRYKEAGYIHINILQHGNFGVTTPNSLYRFILNGGMKGVTDDIHQVSHIDLSSLGTANSVYTEISGGYSHKLNDQWTIGGKLKFLIGEAYVGLRSKDLGIDASLDQWDIHGNSEIALAAPINLDALPERITYEDFSAIDFDKLINTEDLSSLIKPSGYGAAIDFGFTYKPIEQVQITGSLNDLGFIYWSNSRRYAASIDSTFTGLGNYDYNNYVVDGSFSLDSLLNDVTSNLANITNAIHTNTPNSGFARMINMNFNVGVDANFWNNRVGVGVLSRTRLVDSRLYEELTLGAAFRPVNWFNLAVSYSLLENGKFSNIGAGLSFMPYDGINLTLAMDYIPTSYASANINETPKYIIPYKAKGVNLAFGFSVVWGTNKKKDKVDADSQLAPAPAAQPTAQATTATIVETANTPADRDINDVNELDNNSVI